MSEQASNYRKTGKGHSAQARFYASNLERPDDTWRQLGWIPDRGGAKPVYELLDGTPVAIYDGKDHLTVVVQGVDASTIRATEEECFSKAVR